MRARESAGRKAARAIGTAALAFGGLLGAALVMAGFVRLGLAASAVYGIGGAIVVACSALFLVLLAAALVAEFWG